LLGINRPEVDGHNVCCQLQTHPATSPIPLIFLAEKSHGDEGKLPLQLGAHDCNTQPIFLSVVLARVRAKI